MPRRGITHLRPHDGDQSALQGLAALTSPARAQEKGQPAQDKDEETDGPREVLGSPGVPTPAPGTFSPVQASATPSADLITRSPAPSPP